MNEDSDLISLLDSVPEGNQHAFRALYALEVGLREFIIKTLRDQFGEKWWKSRLPNDVKAKYEAGFSAQKQIRWVRLVPHHPLYYIDFPDLIKIIEKGDNWKEVFQPVMVGPFLGPECMYFCMGAGNEPAPDRPQSHGIGVPAWRRGHVPARSHSMDAG